MSNIYQNQGPANTVSTVHGNWTNVTHFKYALPSVGLYTLEPSPTSPRTSTAVHSRPDPIYFRFYHPDGNFTGRSRELSLLEDATVNHQCLSGHKPPIVVVSGLGGIGKTQLVRKFVDVHETFYQNVIWINAHERSSMLGEIAELASNYLRISTQSDGKDKDLKSLLEEVVKKLSVVTTVIVFDNVDELENKEIVKIVIPLKTPGIRPHIIITSRIQEWSGSIHSIKLNVFDAGDALEYVSTKLSDVENVHNDSDEVKRNLVEKLQYFPLALAQAIAHINYHRVVERFDISDYIREYDSSFREQILDSKFFQNDELNLYEQTTRTTWKITIAAIKKCGATGDLALRIFRIMAYFDPDHIRRDIFFNLEHRTDAETEVKSAVRLLVNYSMVNSQKQQSVLSVHRLVQQVTKIELEVGSDSKKTVLV